MKFPLSYTMVDLEEILAPGTYRLCLVDARGEELGLKVGVSVGNVQEDGEGRGEVLRCTPDDGIRDRLYDGHQRG